MKLQNYNQKQTISFSDVEEFLNKSLDTSTKLLDTLNEIENKSKNLIFLTPKDIREATGWSKRTIEKLFADPDFPSCNFGKTQVVEIRAAIEYFSKPRRKEDSLFWLNAA